MVCDVQQIKEKPATIIKISMINLGAPEAYGFNTIVSFQMSS